MTQVYEGELRVLLGINADIDTGTEEVVPVARGTLVASVGYVASIASSDNTNDKAAGTGALTARITGLALTTLAEQYEDVTLNGTTAVETVLANFVRINSVEVLTAGSTGSNTGTITTSLNAQAQDTMPIAHGRSHQATYAVPAGKRAVIHRINASVEVAASAVIFEYRSIETLSAPGAWKTYNFGTLQATAEAGTQSIEIGGAIVVPAKHEFRVKITSLADNNICSAAVFYELR